MKRRKISFLVCEFSPIKIHLSDYPKTLITRINEVYVFFNKNSYSDILLENISFIKSCLFFYNHTCYCVNMVSVMSVSRYHPRYQSRSSMYIPGLIPGNLAELIRR